MRRFLPRFYVEGFADAQEGDNGSPVVWVHRPAIGVFQRTPIEPDGSRRHFNEVDEPALRKNDDLERLLAAVEDDTARLIREKLARRLALAPAERDVLASFFALLGIRLSSRFGDLDEAEGRHGYDELLPALRDMGWVLWEADAPDYFVSSDAPFHVAFPKDDGLVQGMELQAPGIEITLPLSPRLALHATWKRRGELWRSVTEDVLLELNARTLFRARRFVLAPKPAIPG
ncbi:MAG TPA: DUF4238 domain-containing protein [Anaeromyxobacter sp.]